MPTTSSPRRNDAWCSESFVTASTRGRSLVSSLMPSGPLTKVSEKRSKGAGGAAASSLSSSKASASSSLSAGAASSKSSIGGGTSAASSSAADVPALFRATTRTLIGPATRPRARRTDAAQPLVSVFTTVSPADTSATISTDGARHGAARRPRARMTRATLPSSLTSRATGVAGGATGASRVSVIRTLPVASLKVTATARCSHRHLPTNAMDVRFKETTALAPVRQGSTWIDASQVKARKTFEGTGSVVSIVQQIRSASTFTEAKRSAWRQEHRSSSSGSTNLSTVDVSHK